MDSDSRLDKDIVKSEKAKIKRYQEEEMYQASVQVVAAVTGALRTISMNLSDSHDALFMSGIENTHVETLLRTAYALKEFFY